jgi:hypothetical protein
VAGKLNVRLPVLHFDPDSNASMSPSPESETDLLVAMKIPKTEFTNSLAR